MTIEELKEAIVHVAMDHAPAPGGTLLVYAELHDDELSCALVHEPGGAGETTVDDEVADLRYLVRNLWEEWHHQAGLAPWTVMACRVDDGLVEFDFSAPKLAADSAMPIEERLFSFRSPAGENRFDLGSLNA